MSGTIVVCYLPHTTWLAAVASTMAKNVPQSLVKALAVEPVPQSLAPISNEKIRNYYVGHLNSYVNRNSNVQDRFPI